MGTRKGMDVIWALDAIYHICLCTNLCTYLFMHLCQRKKSFIKIPEFININFSQIWHFAVKGTGWVGLELSINFRQTVGRFNMWVTPYTGMLTLAKRNISYLKTWLLRHYKVILLLITQRDIQSMEQELLPAKVKPDSPIQNFDLWWNWD